jgi:hypothetical protein
LLYRAQISPFRAALSAASTGGVVRHPSRLVPVRIACDRERAGGRWSARRGHGDPAVPVDDPFTGRTRPVHAGATIRPNGDPYSPIPHFPLWVYAADMTSVNGSSPTLAARRRLGMAAAARAPTPTTAAPTHVAGRRPSVKVAGLT